ncbi:XRE family transcriptional regulator of biofilm formation [Paenibacillus castaneae]|uniref:helix-turn-helix domain-containing protein n=1 Tax=Paenibacillus castaneae TaxID=474957 RepID=UPI000C9A8A0C|nr:helix-turn-helix domain-containing protein [Paenibacillus castaneae]NIK76081.1 XRE family transcriptional regulator of biofilm formation [Paenibacillus castaneae]
MIGERIQSLRKRKGLSLTELSQRAGVAKSYLSSIERGLQQNPSIQFLEKIGNVLNVTVEDFINSDEDSAQKPDQLDNEWTNLVREAMSSGVSKDQFKEFLEFNKWKIKRE